MPLVVSDTSPIRALHHLGLLDLLGELFGNVLVPPGVADELAEPATRYSPIDLRCFRCIEVSRPRDSAAVQALRDHLGPGESEAIIPAEEYHADLLIDEAAGRAEAQRRGLHIVGVAGVLLLAKHNGHVASVLPLLDRLKSEIGFFVSQEFRQQVKQLAGE